MITNGQVGAPAQSLPPGTTSVPFRQGNMADAIVSELHGRRYEGSYRKSRFGGAMQAVIATATTAGFPTALTGAPVLYNPPGSGVNVVVESFGCAYVVASANALGFGLATGFSNTALSGTLTTLNPKSKFVGSGIVPVAGLCASATITLPVAATADIYLGQLGTGATSVPAGLPAYYDIGGEIVLPPGAFCHYFTTAVLAASSLLASFSWEEVPA